jgi:hypothetical protein
VLGDSPQPVELDTMGPALIGNRDLDQAAQGGPFGGNDPGQFVLLEVLHAAMLPEI